MNKQSIKTDELKETALMFLQLSKKEQELVLQLMFQFVNENAVVAEVGGD